MKYKWPKIWVETFARLDSLEKDVKILKGKSETKPKPKPKSKSKK